MKPVYENVARYFKDEEDCILAMMDADASHNKLIASMYGVKSYPTLTFLPKGKENKGDPITYTGGRSEKAFVDFLNEKCGTQRAVGGGLNDLAGRLPHLDELAQKFIDATNDVRKTVLAEATALGKDAKGYVRVMEKIVEKSDGYVTKELKRCALSTLHPSKQGCAHARFRNRLESILAKRTLGSKKLDEIKTKYNVLSTFVKREPSEKVGRAGDEL